MIGETTGRAPSPRGVPQRWQPARHAKMFTLRALELDPSRATDPTLFQSDFEHLFSRLGEARFMAFVYLGERRGRAQMQLFREELHALADSDRADPKTGALLDAVMKDETQLFKEFSDNEGFKRWLATIT